MPVRVDKWLWAVRVYKTRSQANLACTSGCVEVNGATAKPSTRVDEGDVVTARRRDRTVEYVVRDPIDKRVSALRAAACVEDRSPAPEPREPPAAAFGRRPPGAGRPTKRDRRQIDRLRRRGTGSS